MAYFAELDKDNKVIQVIVVHNNELTREDGTEHEYLGIAFLHSVYGSDRTWKQTSYNSTFRVNFAGIGMGYDSENDMFYHPISPYPSWTYNETTGLWDPPIARPATGADDKIFEWNESEGNWIKRENI